MDGTPTCFWGKLELAEDGSVRRWHPLIHHCADVAASARIILERSTLRKRLAAIGRIAELTDAQCDRLAALATLHDIGKFNSGFQRKASPNATGKAGHVQEVMNLLAGGVEQSALLADSLGIDVLEHWSSSAEQTLQLLAASICHHGRPRRVDGGQRLDVWQSGADRDPFIGIAELRRAVEAWFPGAFQPDAGPLPGNIEFQHAFSGLVTLADWLGSDTVTEPRVVSRSSGYRRGMERRASHSRIWIHISSRSVAACGCSRRIATFVREREAPRPRGSLAPAREARPATRGRPSMSETVRP